jgi:uncharacterized coiled-coil DUF342 family protein
MRYSIFLLLVPIVLSAQSSTADQKLTEMLIREVQQLRIQIERSTLLSARTQLAVCELQLQEAAVARLTQQYNEVRSGNGVVSARRSQLAEKVQELEFKKTTGDPALRGLVEMQLKQAKVDLGEAIAADQERSAKESEVTSQLNAARSGAADARNRIAELQRMLDAASQQLPKQN